MDKARTCIKSKEIEEKNYLNRMEDDFIQDKKVSKDLFIKISIYFELNFLHFQLTFEYISSNINEFTRSVFLFYLFNFFYKKTSQGQKCTNPLTVNKNNKKRKYKKHLRGKKLLIRLFAFCAFTWFCFFMLLVLLVLFVRVKSYHKKIKSLKLT